LFYDITPILQNISIFTEVIDVLAESLDGLDIDLIAGIESRGFIFASTLSIKLNKGFIPIRKPGKLPYQTFREKYQLEYGTDALEIHQDAVKKDQKVLLVDDLLATGGTAKASAKLIEKCGGEVSRILFLIELAFLNGREQIDGYDISSIITY